MKKAILLLIASVMMLGSCDLINNSRKKKIDPATLAQALQGGWKLSQGGADEIWYFAINGNSRTYVKMTRFDEEYGTWVLNQQGIQLEDIFTNNVKTSEIELDNNLLLLSNLSLTLSKDSSVIPQLEKRLSEQLVGKWRSEVEETVYEFNGNGFMHIQYTDDISEDGTWKVKGNQLIDNDSEFSAATIAFNDNLMQWSTETYQRIGDAQIRDLVISPDSDDTDDSSSSSTNTNSNPLEAAGVPITRHSFQANLGNFGQVSFEPYWEDRYGASKVHYYLTKNGVPVYELPRFRAEEGKFDGLRAAASRDVNGDGKLDIVLMADYMQEGPDGSGTTKEINGVYLNQGSSFSFDQNLSRRLNSNEDINSVSDILAEARKVYPTNTKKSSSSAKAVSNNYTKYRKDKSICRIRIASLSGTIDYEKLGKLSDLGILSFEPADNGLTRVYLGKYISKYTAYKILNTVKARGYRDAFVVIEQDYINNTGEGDPPFSTFQIAASKKPNLSKLNELDDQYRSDVYISFTGSNYRVSLGVYQKELYPYLEQEFATLGSRLGYADGFSKTIK